MSKPRSAPDKPAMMLCACCGYPMNDEPEEASDGELIHRGCEEQYEDIVYFREFDEPIT